MNESSPIGEIVESATSMFVAQCLEIPREIIPRLYDPPPLGSFVKVALPLAASAEALLPETPLVEAFPPALLTTEVDPFETMSLPSAFPPSQADLSPAIFGLVYAAKTTSLEANRRPSALGFADEDELRREQPQIFELLCTEFSALLIAYMPPDGKSLRRHLPPRPPRIHSRVSLCSPEEVRTVTADLSFLRTLLLSSGGAPLGATSDEIVAACLRQAKEAQVNEQEFLERAGRTLASLLTQDYDRLQAILRAVF
jgi:hypothetical protein